MIHIAYPEPQFKVREEGGKHFIFDSIRKAWLVLTDEEWVRQNFVHYLIATLHYPSSLIALEKEMELHGLKKRFDVLVFDERYRPWMLVECKAPNVPLNDAVLQQLLRYHMTMPATYLVITNGNNTYGWQKEEGALRLMHRLPYWP